jgi:integrase
MSAPTTSRPARKSAKPKPSRAVAPGIQRIVDGGGDVSYKAQVRRQGHPAQAKRFASLDDAQKWKRSVEADMDRGAWVDKREAAKHTVGALFARYRTEVSPTKRGGDIEASRLLAFGRDPIAKLNATIVQTNHVEAWLARRRTAGVSGSTMNRELNLMSHVFAKARQSWSVRIENPVSDVDRPEHAKPRERRIGEDELEAICAASESSELRPVLRLAVLTAMRRGEILGMRWEHVDLTTRIVELQLTKNGEARRVPLPEEAVQIISAVPRPVDDQGKVVKTGRIFTSEPHSLSTAMRRARKRARDRYVAQCIEDGIDADPKYLLNVRLHDGRHEATSRLVEGGADQMTTAKILGHKSLVMTMRYFNPSDEHLRAAMDASMKKRKA